ncbi:MAG: LamG-like jellyroll fold domain-containing protein [Rhodobacterales bacterium]|jgi:hypothetical protein
MNLGLGLNATGLLSLGSISGPARLIRPSDIGVLFDASNRARLFSNPVDTLPVTTPGQSVAFVPDLGPLGMHATQATHSARPTWEVDEQGRGYLAFDGIDDGLQTPTLAWGTGQATLVVAIRKDSDAARGIVLVGKGSQVFVIEAPHGVGVASLAVGHQGANVLRRDAVVSGQPAPVSCVIAGTCDLAGSVVTMRLNGVPQTSNTAATDGGVFLNSPLILGRRGAGSLAFTGRIHQIFAVNRLLPTAEIEQVERWMRSKSGAF